MNFVRKACLWVLLIPILTFALGCLSNQAVLIANGDKFPVLLNPVWMSQAAKVLQVAEARNAAGMLDQVHCVMTPDTSLNWLADWIDAGSSMCSPGDLLIWSGLWMWSFAPYMWGGMVLVRLGAWQ